MFKIMVHFFVFFLLSVPATAQQETEISQLKQEINQLKLELRMMQGASDTLAVLWTSGDPDVALKMVFMYINGSLRNGWWKSVHLIIWGPSSKLTSENRDIQNKIKELQNAGAIVEACKACADQYGVSEKLEALGITVRYMGEPLTEFLKSNKKVVTF